MIGRRRLTTVFLLALATVVVTSGAAPHARADRTVEGNWTGTVMTTTRYASLLLTLKQNGPQVSGVYQGGAKPYNVEGMLAGNVLMLRILNSRGHLHLVLSDDGRTMTGSGMDVLGAHLSDIRLSKI